MDDDLLKLAERLCAVAGMLMEDHAIQAISTSKAEDQTDRLDTLYTAAEDMTKLIVAAKVLTRLS